MKHTPGPWESASDKGIIRLDNCFEIRVFSLSDADIAPANAYAASKDEAKANARLIAASPNMHTACLGAAIQLRFVAETLFDDFPNNPAKIDIAETCQKYARVCEKALPID